MAALAAPRLKRERRAPKKFEETLSFESESDESNTIIYEDSSESEVDEAINTFEGSTSYCAKCLNVFRGKEKESAIRCDTPYC